MAVAEEIPEEVLEGALAETLAEAPAEVQVVDDNSSRSNCSHSYKNFEKSLQKFMKVKAFALYPIQDRNKREFHKMRLDKLMANSGFGTRTEVKKLLKSGVVCVDGKTLKDGSAHVDPEKCNVTVSGEVLVFKEFVYYMMNKPQGYISATEDQYLKTVLDLLKPEDVAKGLFPAGRLDRDTEGMLLLTNDGLLAHQLLSPKKHVPKTYFAEIDGVVTEIDVEKFKLGVTLEDGYETKPAELVVLKSGQVSEIELTITEGKFHQVKRMFEAVDKKVVFLKRLSMGNLKLDETLKLGEYRELTERDLNLIQN